ncbi:hypothetical protein [Streptomyces sp. NPDC059071]|uniref:hypothetical protein n=1 Tax=unclassified Streptomyces TaxID=2593676 RepID=UPI00364E7A9A
MKIQVTACDIDRATPATTIEVTVDGETVAMDLCAEHARPIYDLIEQVRSKTDDVPAPRVAQSDEPATQSNPPTPTPRARKAAAKRPAKKADGRRKAVVTSMEDIQAQLKEQEG